MQLTPNQSRCGLIDASIPLSRARSASGFTLLEMIGVCGVIAVLAAMLLPAAIRRIDMRVREQEVSALNSISNALAISVVRSQSVPEYNGWGAASATFCALPASQVTTNPRRFTRVYYRESGPSLPYTQGVNGTATPPDRLRAVIVSILAGEPLDPGVNCPSVGSTMSDSDFQHLWELPNSSRPTLGLWANWEGAGDDVLVQRVNYAPLFHRLILINRDRSPLPPPTYTIDGSTFQELANTWPNNPGLDRYYLDGTVIGLGSPDYGSGATNETRYALKRDISFVFERGTWRSKILGEIPNATLAAEFAEQAANFMNATWNDDAFRGANQQGVVTAMYTFMLTYTFWADKEPYHFPWRTASSLVQVPEYEMLAHLGDPNGRLDVFSDRLLR